MIRSKKRIVGTLILAAIALLISGCSNPSDAASLKSGKITIEELQKSVSTILKERIAFNAAPENALVGEELTRYQLGFRIFSALLTQAAKERNIVALPGDIASRRAEVLRNVGGEQQLSVALVNAGIASIDLEKYLELTILQDKLTSALAPNTSDEAQVFAALQKVLAETAASEKLTVNPRYGVWNTTTNKVEAIDPTGGALPTDKQ